MKSLLLGLLFTLFFTTAYTQRHGAYLGVGTEFTVGGQVGSLHLGAELNRHIFGISLATKISSSDNTYNPANDYIGLQYQFTFYREKNLNVGIMIRAGTVDEQFYALAPSLNFDYIFN